MRLSQDERNDHDKSADDHGGSCADGGGGDLLDRGLNWGSDRFRLNWGLNWGLNRGSNGHRRHYLNEMLSKS